MIVLIQFSMNDIARLGQYASNAKNERRSDIQNSPAGVEINEGGRISMNDVTPTEEYVALLKKICCRLNSSVNLCVWQVWRRAVVCKSKINF